MTNNILPVFETVEFVRVVTYGEGKKGKFAVAIVKRDQNEYTTLFPQEDFPFEKLQLIQEGQIIKVKPSQGGLRARLKDQDIKLIAQNTEDIAIEVCHLKDKVDGLENRQSERFDHLEKVVNQLKTLIVWWDEHKDE
tara:strand:- start:224 stop:634 length:411 start_codon:yes stop_codon:yes gene_type:complete